MKSDSIGTGNWIESWADPSGEREAIGFEGRTLRYAELAEAAHAVAADLEACGAQAGDLVAVLAPASVAGLALIHALLDRGIVLLPLNARLSSPERRLALEASGARYLVVPFDEAGEGAEAMIMARKVGCGLWALDEGSAVRPWLDARLHPSSNRGGEWDSRRARRLAERAALVLRTSGTSGAPKGAVLGLDQLKASAVGSAGLLGSAASDRWLLCMPLFHIGGLSILIRAALVGACVVVEAKFDAARIARLLESERITRVSFVAAMLDRLLAIRGDQRAPSSLELVLLGGGPASDELQRRATQLGYPIAPTYGLTEAASQVATRPPQRPNEGDPSGGLEPLSGVSLRIVDGERRVLGSGEEGEIEVRGGIVMRGYLDDDAATASVLRDGWLATGDMGRLDSAGRLRVLDRRTDLIVSGGENIYPAEIESVLEDHASVLEAGVRGIPDEKYGMRPVAFVVPIDSSMIDLQQLRAHCRERLAAYKCPVTIECLPLLPRNATGKLIRRKLPDGLSTAD